MKVTDIEGLIVLTATGNAVVLAELIDHIASKYPIAAQQHYSPVTLTLYIAPNREEITIPDDGKHWTDEIVREECDCSSGCCACWYSGTRYRRVKRYRDRY